MEIRKHRWIKYHAPEDKELETVIWCADCGLSQLECADPEKDECRFEMIPILTGVKKRLELLCGGEDPWELGKGVEAMLDAEELRDAELRAANEKIANLTGQVIGIRQNLDRAQAEVDRMIGWRGRYEDLMDQLRELESRYNSLFRDLQECRERAQTEEASAIQWRDECGRPQVEKQKLHQDLEKTKATIRNLRSENAVLKERIRELGDSLCTKSHLYEMEAGRDRWRERCQKVEVELAEKEKALEVANNEIDVWVSASGETDPEMLRRKIASLKQTIREKNRELVEGEVPRLPEKGLCPDCEKIWEYFTKGAPGRVKTPMGYARGKPVVLPSNMPGLVRCGMFLGDSVFLPMPKFYLHKTCAGRLEKLQGTGLLEGQTVLERYP